MMLPWPLVLLCFWSLASLLTAEVSPVALSINQFGLDLHRRLAANGGNVVFSPWSIETALAMTYAGADGKTKEEMAKTLHFQADEASTHAGFDKLALDLQQLAQLSQQRGIAAAKQGDTSTPLEVQMANRLFGQSGVVFKKTFLDLNAKTYGAPLELLDFKKSPGKATDAINHWVESVTKQMIKNLIPPGTLNADTRLVLTNAVYFKAAWSNKFYESPADEFFVDGKERQQVPTLHHQAYYGLTKIPCGVAVTIPYADGGLQFVLLIPDEKTGLASMEAKLTPYVFQLTAVALRMDIQLRLPKFKLSPDSVMLAEELIQMGMPTAFDRPSGSADFSRMGLRTPTDYLCLSKVVHKAFISVDKYGTEAAAATAAIMMGVGGESPPNPLIIKADHPFAFAIQHRASGACLFIGRVTDPR